MMKKFLKILFAVFLGAMAFAENGRAQDMSMLMSAPLETQKPPLGTGEEVAMIWHRLTGEMPDLDAWAMLDDAVKNAPDFDRQALKAKKAEALLQQIKLLVPGDQIVAEMPVTLSEYDLENKGYLIESFTESTFLKYAYAGHNFGIVPRALIDHQWIAIEGMSAKKIDDLRQASKTGKDAVLTLFLQPKSAAPKPVTIGEESWRLVAAEVAGMAFFDGEGQLLWTEKRAATGLTVEENKQQKELMNLYR